MPQKEDLVADATDTYTKIEKENYAAERSDLAAQWATARYTFVGLILGVLGLFFIIWTLRESGKAAYFTEQALAETKLNSRRELRAYLGIHIIAKNLNDTAQVPTIRIRFQNRGVSPAMSVSCRVIGMGADEIIERRASIQPNDIEEIEWPLEGVIEEEEFFRVKIKYSDIFNGARWVNADFFVIPAFDFPTLLVPDLVEEREIQFRYYTDDLQLEAEQYAEANQPT